MRGPAVPGDAGDGVGAQERQRNAVQVGQRAQDGAGGQRLAAVARRDDGGGDRGAENDLSE